MKRTKKDDLGKQMKRRNKKLKKKPKEKAYEGNTELMLSTGSTLLDLAICGTRKRGGGLPGGILVEAFGPEGSGKTVLLCELAGAIQRIGGDVMFNDPEARLNTQFAKMFDFDINAKNIKEPDTVTEFIANIREWKPIGNAKINGAMTDSLAALSTKLEMDDPNGDKMGMRRAKEFSEGLRKICRILKQQNYILACSNQIREKADAGGYGEKFTTPGGYAFKFYSSVRLRFYPPKKIKRIVKIAGKEVKKVFATKVPIEVYKNSCDVPYRTADIYIQFDYGIDDIRANIQYLKDYTSAKGYELNGQSLGASMDKAIAYIEENELENELKETVIDLWEEIQEKLTVPRKKKLR